MLSGAPGERIRVEISSSDYPQFAPNPNTGERFGQNTATQAAVQTILHDAAHPSRVILPVIAGTETGARVNAQPRMTSSSRTIPTCANAYPRAFVAVDWTY